MQDRENDHTTIEDSSKQEQPADLDDAVRDGKEGEVEADQPGEESTDAGAPDVEALQERLAALEAELEESKKQVEEADDRYLRLRAEFENFRRRTRQEAEELRARAAEGLAVQLLPVVDNLERAVAAGMGAQQDPKAFADGVEMVLKQFLQELAKVGVSPVEAVGKPFDPNLHEAVMYEESDQGPDGTVIEEFQKGYVLNDKVLRPSMVKVAKAR